MLSRGVVWQGLIVTVLFGAGLLDQDSAAGRLMTASSPIGAMVCFVNRLKTLKRAMYGRAGPNLLRARMLPLHHTN